MNKELKAELNSILTRERIISSLDSLDDRTSLIATLRNFKEKYDLTNLPVPKRQRGLIKFLKEMDKIISKTDYIEKDDEDFKTTIITYLDASEGAGAPKVEKEKEEAEEEKEEEKTEMKTDTIKETEMKRKEAEKKLESTIEEIGEMAGDEMTDESLNEEIKKSEKDLETKIDKLRDMIDAPTPNSIPPPTPASSPREPPPIEEPEPEEKPIEDISTQQVIEIPSERKGTDGKSIKQLNADIRFFLSKYPFLLKEESGFYSKMKKTKRNLVELHRRIEAKLAPLEKKDPKTIGIIVDADSYIDARIKALLVEKTMEGLTPKDMVVDVTEQEDKSIMRKGSYVLSKGRSGRLAVERAPVYRNIPTTNPQPRARPYQDVTMLKSQRWDLANNAKKHVLEDPFIKPQPKQRINILL